MAELTTNPNDPRLGHGADDSPVPQQSVYLVLSEEERSKGFIRPFRDSYRHVGKRPKFPLRELTDEEKEHFGSEYTMFEVYPAEMAPKTGRYWTQKQLEQTGCGTVTKMGRELSETYAVNPKFYGSTYCVGCKMHRPVDEFVWDADNQVVGS